MKNDGLNNYDYANCLLEEIQLKGIEKPFMDKVLYGLHHQLDDSKLVYASVYTSGSCQLNCIYCSKHYDIKRVSAGEIEVLSKNEILDFIKDAYDIGLKTLIFQGMAEPTYDENFREYIAYACNLGINCVVFSNIIDLDDSLAEFLFSNNVSLIPSVDSLNRDTYNYLTGSDKYDSFIAAVDVLKKHFGGKNKWVEGKYPRVLLSMVVSDYNIVDLKAIRELCNSQGWLLCSKAFGVKGAAKDNFDGLAKDREYYNVIQKLAVDYADKVMVTQTIENKCACGGRCGMLVDIDGSIGACGDGLTRVNANIRKNTLLECFKTKKDYVDALGDYICLSKALRGYGDLKI